MPSAPGVGANGEVPLGILRVSPVLRERLLAAPAEAGRVHSAFDRALNILWHDGRLVALHGPGPLAAPFAAALTRLPEPGSVTVGAPVLRRGRFIHLHTTVLDAETGVPAAVRIQPSAEDPGRPASLLIRLEAPSGAPGLASSAGDQARRRLAEGIRRHDGEAFVEGACGLIGLGEGLTPAGDDCLVGALAILHRFAGSWLAGCPEMGARVAEAARTGTTVVGGEFILHALEGAFSEILVEFVTAAGPDEARQVARRLIETGGTSGRDTWAGAHLALGALCRRESKRAPV